MSEWAGPVTWPPGLILIPWPVINSCSVAYQDFLKKYLILYCILYCNVHKTRGPHCDSPTGGDHRFHSTFLPIPNISNGIRLSASITWPEWQGCLNHCSDLLQCPLLLLPPFSAGTTALCTTQCLGSFSMCTFQKPCASHLLMNTLSYHLLYQRLLVLISTSLHFIIQ